ncbi:MAG: alpha/beta hydrolase [Sandaracinaceae bacterium]|nr:alpha/beta hydrolase [Sandaracinaceae bacterium]
MRLRDRVRRQAGSLVVDSFFRGVSSVGRLHPRARPEHHGVEVVRDVRYAAGGSSAHLLDVYRPVGHRPGELRPAVLYVHGGGFRILSKDTHWVMGLAFARRGYVVFSINYRLAPEHRYPAAIEDCARAYGWVAEHAHAWGGDASRLVLAGESAGANLVTAMTVAACFERSEPEAAPIVRSGVVPKAVLPACGILQVSDTARFTRRKPGLARVVAERIEEVGEAYLGPLDHPSHHGRETLDLADPLVVLESERPAKVPLPPFFAPCGTADPLLDDTRRLAAALRRRGGLCEDLYYPGEVHAFHAFVFRPQAQKCWRDTFAFLDRHCPPEVQGARARSAASAPA